MLKHTLLTLTGLISLSTAGYVLEDDYEPSSFFSMFSFFTGGDPTHGYVNYLDQGTAQSQGLINTNGPVYIGVDHTNVATGSGRSSVRITSNKAYNHGLIILDAAHMPGGVCGTWPAFWTVGPNWPANGEIDIIEGVNSQSTDSMTLHTGPGCSITNNGAFSGTLGTTNCDINAAGQATNAGCQINTPNSASYGNGFNAGQGGVYATEWTSQAISIWFFPRSAIPSDIASGSPDPTSWGAATASFAGGCNIDQFFNNQQIVFDTTFCGDWAGNVWGTDPVCSSKAATCQAYVQNNPADFANAFWSINSLKVYQSNGASTPAVSASASAGIIPSISVPAPIGPSQPGQSVPIPNPTSFATVATGAPQPPVSQPQPGQQSFSFSHHSHGGGFTNTAIVAPTGTNDGVVVSSIVAPVETEPSSSPTTTEAQVAVATSTSSTPSEASPGGFFSQNPSSSAVAAAATSTTSVAPATTTAPVSNPSGPHPPPGVQWITVSALEIDQFPSEGETQTRGTNGKRWIFVGDELFVQERSNDENEIMNEKRDERVAERTID